MAAASEIRGTTPAARTVIAVSGASAPETAINEALRALGFAPVEMVSTIGDVIALLRSRVVHLVIVPVDRPAGELAGFAAELRRHDDVVAIGTAPVKDGDTVLAAMRAGIPEFLTSPLNAHELTAAVTRLQASAPATTMGRVFTTYSGKGGLGTSTLAVSLSWALARLNENARVALVDFTTTGAGIRVMLNLQPPYDLGSVAANPERIDVQYLRSVMVDHEDGVSVLAAAEELDVVDSLNTVAATRLIDVLRREFAYVVVDTDHHFADQTIAALDAADRILLVAQLDISALRSTQRSLGIFARLGYPLARVEVVVNRRSDRDQITVIDAEKVLGRGITHCLPNDYGSCSSAINAGRFVQRHAPTSPVESGVEQVAASLCGLALPGNGNGSSSRRFRLFGRW